VAGGVISEAESALLASQRELAARVVRVDDFAQDLGTSLLAPRDQREAATPARPVASPRTFAESDRTRISAP